MDGDRVVGLEAEHDAILHVQVAVAHTGMRVTKRDHDLLADLPHALARLHGDGHARPARAAERGAQLEVALRDRLRRYALDLTEALVLRPIAVARDLLARQGMQHIDHGLRTRLAYRRSATSGRLFHGDERQHLQQVVLAHIAQCTHAVVKAAALLNSQRLHETDVDRLHRVAVPRSLKEVVGEPEVQDALQHLLGEIVVDAIDLLLAEQAAQQIVELPGRAHVVAKGLLHQHARPTLQVAARLGEPACE